ncbi:peptidoglycan-binding protein [Anabaena sp. FACHB-1237]|uniref:glycoside hydrolase family protein n=1 Tax=Anabaena sp. FACHB-1237 TaxID=2692769 RepID=UPI001680AC67|nr:peptidoglycan-binding protein [Anabaena sp. FACHB-1237]MBD2138209.1 peptidoglycan-binding protein [Anabaena sp. FACHB-1237]
MNQPLTLNKNELLKKGSRGAKVKQLQEILTFLKFNPGTIDGDFGNNTLAAVKDFQKQQKLSADGIVGENTQTALNLALQAVKKPQPVTVKPEIGTTTVNPTNTNATVGKVPLCGVNLIKEFEGFFENAYTDPLTGNKPITIGWGSTRKKDGSEWKLGDKITRDEAQELLITQLENNYLPPLEKIPVWPELNINQRGALLSFAYNLGANFYGAANFQTITRVLRDKKWDEIEAAFLKYVNPGSRVEAGLRRRRLAEAKLFLTPV